MNKSALEEYLAKFKGSEASEPFGPEALVYKVMDKMFALVSQKQSPVIVTLKCDPDDAVKLIKTHSAISEGYYMNKKHWITVTLDQSVPKALLIELMDNSYSLVVSKLPKSKQKRLK